MIVDMYTMWQLLISYFGFGVLLLYCTKKRLLSRPHFLVGGVLIFGETLGVLLTHHPAFIYSIQLNQLLLIIGLYRTTRQSSGVFIFLICFNLLTELSRMGADLMFLLYTTHSLDRTAATLWISLFSVLRLSLLACQPLIYRKLNTLFKPFQLSYETQDNRYVQVLQFLLFLCTWLSQPLFDSPSIPLQRFHYTFGLSLILTLVFVLFYSYYTIGQFRNQYLFQLEKEAAQKESLENLRRLNHDFNTILFSLSGYVKENENEKALALIASLSDYILEETPHTNYQHLLRIEEKLLRTILFSFLKKCLDRGYAVVITVEEAQPLINDLLLIDLVRALTIVLDNAYQANEEAAAPAVRIALRLTDRSAFCRIQNPIEEHSPPVDLFLKKGFSTKERHSGLGLANLEKLVMKYDDSFLQLDEEAGWFTLAFRIGIVS